MADANFRDQAITDRTIRLTDLMFGSDPGVGDFSVAARNDTLAEIGRRLVVNLENILTAEQLAALKTYLGVGSGTATSGSGISTLSANADLNAIKENKIYWIDAATTGTKPTGFGSAYFLYSAQSGVEVIHYAEEPVTGKEALRVFDGTIWGSWRVFNPHQLEEDASGIGLSIRADTTGADGGLYWGLNTDTIAAIRRAAQVVSDYFILEDQNWKSIPGRITADIEGAAEEDKLDGATGIQDGTITLKKFATEVLASFMGTAAKPVTLPADTDINTLTDPGIYRGGASYTNGPLAAGSRAEPLWLQIKKPQVAGKLLVLEALVWTGGAIAAYTQTVGADGTRSAWEEAVIPDPPIDAEGENIRGRYIGKFTYIDGTPAAGQYQTIFVRGASSLLFFVPASDWSKVLTAGNTGSIWINDKLWLYTSNGFFLDGGGNHGYASLEIPGLTAHIDEISLWLGTERTSRQGARSIADDALIDQQQGEAVVGSYAAGIDETLSVNIQQLAARPPDVIGLWLLVTDENYTIFVEKAFLPWTPGQATSIRMLKRNDEYITVSIAANGQIQKIAPANHPADALTIRPYYATLGPTSDWTNFEAYGTGVPFKIATQSPTFKPRDEQWIGLNGRHLHLNINFVAAKADPTDAIIRFPATLPGHTVFSWVSVGTGTVGLIPTDDEHFRVSPAAASGNTSDSRTIHPGEAGLAYFFEGNWSVIVTTRLGGDHGTLLANSIGVRELAGQTDSQKKAILDYIGGGGLEDEIDKVARRLGLLVNHDQPIELNAWPVIAKSGLAIGTNYDQGTLVSPAPTDTDRILLKGVKGERDIKFIRQTRATTSDPWIDFPAESLFDKDFELTSQAPGFGWSTIGRTGGPYVLLKLFAGTPDQANKIWSSAALLTVGVDARSQQLLYPLPFDFERTEHTTLFAYWTDPDLNQDIFSDANFIAPANAATGAKRYRVYSGTADAAALKAKVIAAKDTGLFHFKDEDGADIDLRIVSILPAAAADVSTDTRNSLLRYFDVVLESAASTYKVEDEPEILQPLAQGLPDAPENESAAKNYELQVPASGATDEDAKWVQAAEGQSAVDQTARTAAAAAQATADTATTPIEAAALADAAALARFTPTEKTKLAGVEAEATKVEANPGVPATAGNPPLSTVRISGTAHGLTVPGGAITEGKLADNAVSLPKMKHGTADKFLGYDGTGAPVEKDAPEGTKGDPGPPGPGGGLVKSLAGLDVSTLVPNTPYWDPSTDRLYVAKPLPDTKPTADWTVVAKGAAIFDRVYAGAFDGASALPAATSVAQVAFDRRHKVLYESHQVRLTIQWRPYNDVKFKGFATSPENAVARVSATGQVVAMENTGDTIELWTASNLVAGTVKNVALIDIDELSQDELKELAENVSEQIETHDESEEAHPFIESQVARLRRTLVALSGAPAPVNLGTPWPVITTSGVSGDFTDTTIPLFEATPANAAGRDYSNLVGKKGDRNLYVVSRKRINTASPWIETKRITLGKFLSEHGYDSNAFGPSVMKVIVGAYDSNLNYNSPASFTVTILTALKENNLEYPWLHDLDVGLAVTVVIRTPTNTLAQDKVDNRNIIAPAASATGALASRTIRIYGEPAELLPLKEKVKALVDKAAAVHWRGVAGRDSRDPFKRVGVGIGVTDFTAPIGPITPENGLSADQANRTLAYFTMQLASGDKTSYPEPRDLMSVQDLTTRFGSDLPDAPGNEADARLYDLLVPSTGAGDKNPAWQRAGGRPLQAKDMVARVTSTETWSKQYLVTDSDQAFNVQLLEESEVYTRIIFRDDLSAADLVFVMDTRNPGLPADDQYTVEFTASIKPIENVAGMWLHIVVAQLSNVTPTINKVKTVKV